ncbi:metal ABC transporter permease [Alkalilimnicola ehrlichii]|uniref:metal ABC transporter permease n=1 Tax=Alkalilimnicola ehrlichii TaxID=351052 RepID=UPI003B9FBB79
MMELLFDPLFRMPFLTGLVLAALLPVLGLYLRLREEWLAALGFAHVAGAGAVAGSLISAPLLPAALLTALVAVGVKGLMRRAGNDVYALLIVLGWSAMLLGASLSHHAKLTGQALVDGQLYFTGSDHLQLALGLALLALIALPWLSPRLLREQVFPGHDRANRRPVLRTVLAFEALAALGIAVAATAMGVMSAFALIFIPAWVAYRRAAGWRRAVAWSMALGVLSYLAAFVLAMAADLPFSPVLVALLALLAVLRLPAGAAPAAR